MGLGPSEKSFLEWVSCFGLFAEIKNWFGTSFWCTYSAYCFRRNIPYLILYQLTLLSFNVRPTFFSRYKTICVSNSCLANWCRPNFMIYLQSSTRAMPDRRKKRIRIPWEQKKLLKRNKKEFFIFFKCYHWAKKRKQRAQVLPFYTCYVQPFID